MWKVATIWDNTDKDIIFVLEALLDSAYLQLVDSVWAFKNIKSHWTEHLNTICLTMC